MGTKFRDQISQKRDFPQPILFIFFLISFLFSTSSGIADMMVCMFYESYYNINSIISNSFTCWNTFTNLFTLYSRSEYNIITPQTGKTKVRPRTHPHPMVTTPTPHRHNWACVCSAQAFIATLLFDPSMSALPIIVKQNSPSVSSSFR